jgi:hypothetical protein
MSSGNIVEFPKSKIIRDGSLNNDIINKLKEKSTQNFADDLTQELSTMLLTELDNYGIDIEDDRFTKDFMYLVSIMSAIVYRTVDLKHDFHDFLDNNVVVREVTDESSVDLEE